MSNQVDEMTPDFFAKQILSMVNGNIPSMAAVTENGDIIDLVEGNYKGKYYIFTVLNVFIKSFLNHFPEYKHLIKEIPDNAHYRFSSLLNEKLSNGDYMAIKNYSELRLKLFNHDALAGFLKRAPTSLIKYFIDNIDDLHGQIGGWKIANYIAARVNDANDYESIMYMLSKGSFINDRCDDGYTVLCQILARDKSDKIRSAVAEKYFGTEMSIFETRSGQYIIQYVFMCCKLETLQIILDRIDHSHSEYPQIVQSITEGLYNREMNEEDRSVLLSQILE